jgi:hypothetical protein
MILFFSHLISRAKQGDDVQLPQVTLHRLNPSYYSTSQIYRQEERSLWEDIYSHIRTRANTHYSTNISTTTATVQI